MPESNANESSFGRRMSDTGGLKITKATNLTKPKIPRGWRGEDEKDKLVALRAKTDPLDNKPGN